MNTDVCPLCGEEATASARHHPLVTCKKCQLVRDPAIASSGVLATMEADWFGEETCHVPRDPVTRLLDRANARRTMRRAKIAAGERVLDVGVGTGGTLTHLAEHGVNIEGCDISILVARHAEQRSRRKVWSCPVADVRDAFDTIIASHVLEHQPEPIKFLRDIGEKLRPNGKLLLAVPNMASLDAKSERWISYQPYHLLYFTPRTIRAAAKAAGFEVVRQGTYESVTSWPLLARPPRREPAVHGSGRESRKAVVLRTAGIAIGFGLSPLRWMIAAIGRGDEAYALLRKA